MVGDLVLSLSFLSPVIYESVTITYAMSYDSLFCNIIIIFLFGFILAFYLDFCISWGSFLIYKALVFP